MLDTVNGGLQPQPWHHNIIQTQPFSIFSKIHPHLHSYNGYKGVPICPSTASKGAKTLCIHPIWMLDTVNGGLQPQPWHHNIITAQPFSIFSNIHPHLHSYNGYKGVPICPSTASQGTKTLCIHPIWMWDAVNGGLQPQPWHHNIIQARPYPFSLKFTPTCTFITA
jgi:hypothetical protein